MRAVAADTCRHARVALGEPLAVNARTILGSLIDPLLRRELVHEFGVAVTARAGGDDLLPRRLPAIAPCGIVRFGLPGRRGISAVTVGTRKTTLLVHVALKRFRRRGERRLRQRRVTGNTGSRQGLCGGVCRTEGGTAEHHDRERTEWASEVHSVA